MCQASSETADGTAAVESYLSQCGAGQTIPRPDGTLWEANGKRGTFCIGIEVRWTYARQCIRHALAMKATNA